jgi:hypothetical protein
VISRSGHTLVELLAAMCVAAIVAVIAGKLMLDAMRFVGDDMDDSARVHRAWAAQDAFCDDLEARPRIHGVPWTEQFPRLDSQCSTAAFFASAGGMEVSSVCWFLTGEGPFVLWRHEAGVEATSAALPGNAALNEVGAALAGTPEAVAALKAASRFVCRGLVSLGPYEQGVRIVYLRLEGELRMEDGVAMENLPQGCTDELIRSTP